MDVMALGLRPAGQAPGAERAGGDDPPSPPSSLHLLLQRFDAPHALLAWLARPRRADPWLGCARGDWLIWLAACLGRPLGEVLAAACDCVGRALDALPGHTDVLRNAVALARARRSAEACAAAAADCDAARREYPASYRAGMTLGFAPASRAACWVARAAEGLLTAETRAEVRGTTQARARAVIIGLNPDVMPRRLTGPACLDPIQEELGFVVAAAAQAVKAAARALGPQPQDSQARKEAQAAFAELVRQRLGAAAPADRRIAP